MRPVLRRARLEGLHPAVCEDGNAMQASHPCKAGPRWGGSGEARRAHLLEPLAHRTAAAVDSQGAKLLSAAGAHRRRSEHRQLLRLACRCAASANGKGPVVGIDNYDSFTYNLCQVLPTRRREAGCCRRQQLSHCCAANSFAERASCLQLPTPTECACVEIRSGGLQYLGDLGCEHVVYKNHEISVEGIAALNPRGILVSPGPGLPSQPHLQALLLPCSVCLPCKVQAKLCT